MRVAIAGALVAGCSFTGPAASDPDVAIDAASDIDAPALDVDAPDATPAFAFRVRADIDGRSRLVLHDRSVHWIHFQFAAPGREAGDNIATSLDAVEWFPEWPDLPTAENRDCNGCESSVYDELPLPIPRAPSTVELARITGNRDPTVIQAPDAGNDFTLIVEISDVGFSGSAIYTIDIDVTPL